MCKQTQQKEILNLHINGYSIHTKHQHFNITGALYPVQVSIKVQQKYGCIAMPSI